MALQSSHSAGPNWRQITRNHSVNGRLIWVWGGVPARGGAFRGFKRCPAPPWQFSASSAINGFRVLRDHSYLYTPLCRWLLSTRAAPPSIWRCIKISLPLKFLPCGGANTGRFGRFMFLTKFSKFFDPLSKLKPLYNAGGGRRPFGNFYLSRGVPNYSKKQRKSTWGQRPQVLAGTARRVAKSTRLCSYAVPSCASKGQAEINAN